MDYYPRHRKRLKSLDWTGVNDATLPSRWTVSGSIVSGQETWDEPHSWRAFLAAKRNDPVGFSHLDMGGPFLSYKWSYEDDVPYVSPYFLDGGGRIFTSYSGPQFAKFANADRSTTGAWADLQPSYDLTLDSFGSTAISRCAPTNPHAGALTAITELYRDGLPSAIGLNALRRHDLGGEYLNYEFGILPTWSDLKSLHDANRKAEAYLRQYYRDSTKIVRRRYDFPLEVEVLEDTSSWGVPLPTLSGWLYESTSGSTIRKTVTAKTRRWFSGAFTYYAKEPSSLIAIRDQIQTYNHLYGINPSLSTFWQTLPFSWAADWVTNIGDVLNNVAMYQNDGLVLVYGYVMEHKRVITEYTSTGTVLRGTGAITSTQRFITESKIRRKATPFGFGFELDGFTSRQWAILAALGMSRGRGQLAR